MKGPIRDRFNRKFTVNEETGCHEWQAYRDPAGYGHFHIKRKKMLAHRVSYMLHVGLIPDGLEVHHECHVRYCCNSDHLVLVTHEENMALRKDRMAS